MNILRRIELWFAGTPGPVTASGAGSFPYGAGTPVPVLPFNAASSSVTVYSVGVTEVTGPTANTARIGVSIYNNGTVQIFYRSTTGITTANGYPLDAGSHALLGPDFGSKLAFFFISGTAAQNVRVQEFIQ
jgi:hypothetical protein